MNMQLSKLLLDYVKEEILGIWNSAWKNHQVNSIHVPAKLGI